MKITRRHLRQIIKEEIESTNENSRLGQNRVHILFKKGFTYEENRHDRTIRGVYSSPEKYEKWFSQERLIDPDFNRDDYDLVAYKLDVL